MKIHCTIDQMIHLSTTTYLTYHARVLSKKYIYTKVQSVLISLECMYLGNCNITLTAASITIAIIFIV